LQHRLLDERADISRSSEDSDLSLGAPLPGSFLDDFGGAEDLDAIQLHSLGLSQHPSESSTPPLPSSFGLPVGNIDDLWSGSNIYLNDLKMSAVFVRELQCTSFDDPSCGLSYKALKHLYNPPHEQPSSCIDEDIWLAIDLYLGIQSEKGYEVTHVAILHCWPNAKLPTYYKVKHLVAELSGVESIMNDMCINSYVVYMGPFLGLDACPVCSEL